MQLCHNQQFNHWEYKGNILRSRVRFASSNKCDGYISTTTTFNFKAREKAQYK